MSYSIDMNKATSKATTALFALDKNFIGTPDYLGLAPFWNTEYKHDLRDLTVDLKVKVHQALLKAKLDVKGHSEEHSKVIGKAMGSKGRKVLEKKFGPSDSGVGGHRAGSLRKDLIKLAYDNPEVREDVLPLLKQSAASSREKIRAEANAAFKPIDRAQGGAVEGAMDRAQSTAKKLVKSLEKELSKTQSRLEEAKQDMVDYPNSAFAKDRPKYFQNMLSKTQNAMTSLKSAKTPHDMQVALARVENAMKI